MSNCDDGMEKRAEEVKSRFIGYYSDAHDLFGNNVGKDQLSGRTTMFHFLNFFKTCRIIEKLMQNGFVKLPEYRILDAGCGNGQDLRALVEFGALPENCHGIDFSEAALACARKISPPEMEFRNVSFMKNGYDDAMFDIISSYNTITNYTEDPDIKAVSREFRRLIRPGGILLLICTIADAPRSEKGVAGLISRIFTLENIREFFQEFKIADICSASILKDDFEKNIVVTDQHGEKANLGVLFNWAERLRQQQSYGQFYVMEALKQMVYGMEIIQSGLKLLVLRPQE